MIKFSVIKKSFYFFWISLVLIIGSFVAFFSNLKWSIEFTGWINLTIDKKLDIDKKAFEQAFEDIDAIVEVWEKDNMTILDFRSSDANVEYDEELLWNVTNYLKEAWYIKDQKEITWTSFVWPTIWNYMKSVARIALISWIIIMWIYVFLAFVWVREYFAPWIFSLVTIITLLHDVFIAAWWYWIWMAFNPVSVVDSIFVMAILTILWYSVNDTIIIFDRIRENIKKSDEQLRKWTKKLQEVFDESLRKIMKRSLLTSLSTFLVVFCMYFFWNQLLKDFSLVILIWVLVWTYSSLFLAAPSAYWINKFVSKKD